MIKKLIGDKPSLELGPIFAILDILKKKKFKKTNQDYLMANELRSFFDQYLSSQGKEALKNGELAKIVEPRIRNKYRNPSAHSRYVRLEVALECREYVEKNLLLFIEYLK